MKRIFTLLAGICLATSAFAQTDSTKNNNGDTIRVGSMIIIKRGDGNTKDNNQVQITRRYKSKPKNITTNWWIVDLGINQINDKTNYASAAAQAFAPGANEDWFDLRNGKSINVNIWFFMQRLNVISHVVNLKYGMGLELNNYRFSAPTKFNENPTQVVQIPSSQYTFSKNKLAADYLTVPMMLNFNFTPGKKNNGFGFSAGVSAGFLYSSRQKTITSTQGKQKFKDDFDLRPWKLSYIGEVQLGPIKLYGSMATQSMFKKGLDHTPYNVGLRLSNW
jgi:Outer membrane protein beta-barrel domain